jgi:urease accessory protein
MRTDAEKVREGRPTVLTSLRERPDAASVVEWLVPQVRARRA